MASPTSKTEFVEFCLRKLGYPVIEINVAEDQVDDRVDDALQKYQMFHMDALERMVLTYTLTEMDITNNFIEIEEPVLSITRIFLSDVYASGGNWATDVWQYKAGVFAGLGFSNISGSGLSDYAIRMSHLSLVNDMLDNFPIHQYSMHSNHLYIETDWSEFSPGDRIAYEAYVAIDPNEYKQIWNDWWLKEYGTALIGRQWGNNLSKFQQVELPGGITLDGEGIYNKFDTRIKELDEQLQLEYTLPPIFFMG